MKLKLIALATSLLLTGTTLADKSKRNQFDNWGPVHEFIADHATYVAPGTEAKLYVRRAWALRPGRPSEALREASRGTLMAEGGPQLAKLS